MSMGAAINGGRSFKAIREVEYKAIGRDRIGIDHREKNEEKEEDKGDRGRNRETRRGREGKKDTGGQNP